MGCDIHMYVEKREDKNLPWEMDSNHFIMVEEEGTEDEYAYLKEVGVTGRDYKLFGILADVRSDGCIYKPRGTPNDVSFAIGVEEENIGLDGHTHSWLTLKEFKKCLKRGGYIVDPNGSADAFYDWQEKGFDGAPPDFTTLVNYCERWKDNIIADNILLGSKNRPEVRLIFWFDN